MATFFTQGSIGFSGSINTAFVERLNLTHAPTPLAALTCRSRATAQLAPELEAHLASESPGTVVTPVSEQVLDHGPQQPFFFLFSEQFPTEKNTRLFHRLYASMPASNRFATIRGTAHYDFTDLPRLSPVAALLGLKGPIHAQRVIRIVNDYLIAFFNMTLRGQQSVLFDGPCALYPEVIFSHPTLPDS